MQIYLLCKFIKIDIRKVPFDKKNNLEKFSTIRLLRDTPQMSLSEKNALSQAFNILYSQSRARSFKEPMEFYNNIFSKL